MEINKIWNLNFGSYVIFFPSGIAYLFLRKLMVVVGGITHLWLWGDLLLLFFWDIAFLNCFSSFFFSWCVMLGMKLVLRNLRIYLGSEKLLENVFWDELIESRHFLGFWSSYLLSFALLIAVGDLVLFCVDSWLVIWPSCIFSLSIIVICGELIQII